MRLIKMFGLAALAALASITFVGATTAAAEEPTQLCDSQHVNGLECEDPTGAFSINAVGDAFLLSELIDVLCLHVSGSFNALALGENTQEVHTTSLTVLSCGSTATHNNCTVTVNEAPLFLVLKTELNLGEIEGHGGEIHVKCTVFGFIKIDCTYAAELGSDAPVEGALHSEGTGHGMITLDEEPANLTIGGDLCPENTTLDALLEPSAHLWIAGGEGSPPEGTELCKAHGSSCAEKDQVESVHLVATDAVLLNSVANVECESSLATGSVLGLATEPSAQQVHLSELTWADCHTQGATGNCTVSTDDLPVVDLLRTGLNVGTATVLGLEVSVDCNVLGLHEMECTFGGSAVLEAEGALQKEGTGHGMITAEEDELEELSEGKYCPEMAEWDVLFEALEHVYIVS